MNLVTSMSVLMCMTLLLSLADAKFYRPFQFHQYKSEFEPPYEQKPTSRHKNHCAYVVERSVSFTVQDGAAPYIKADYNKCTWGQKCSSLLYRLMYKPVYKVGHKTVTELEWRCCPGFSGYDCLDGHPMYHQPMRMMPPFMGSPMKGPQFQDTQQNGAMSKGLVFKGAHVNGAVQTSPWSQAKGPPANGFDSFPISHYGAPGSYPHSVYEPNLSEAESSPGEGEPNIMDGNQEQEHEGNQGGNHDSNKPIPEETQTPEEGQPEEEATGRVVDTETKEQIFRMEEDLRRLNQGLETLRGVVTGLEDSLRASLREDANRMLSALLSAAPGPIPAPPSNPSTIGFAEIPGGDLDRDGLDGSHAFWGFSDLGGKVEELRAEVQEQGVELQELKTTVMEHGRILQKSAFAAAPPELGVSLKQSVEKLRSSDGNTHGGEILDGFETQMGSAESHCEEKSGEERHRCQRIHKEHPEIVGRALEGSSEFGNLRAQVQGFKSSEDCCAGMREMEERMQQLNTSVAHLNQSHGHFRVQFGGHRDHIEGLLEGRLAYVESKLNLTGKLKSDESGRKALQNLEARMEDKLIAVEERLLAALEELGNATAPALLEGHALPTLETELESLRGRLELDVDRVQKQLNDLESLCSTSCSTQTFATQGDSAGMSDAHEKEQAMKEVLDIQGDRLDRLNTTLQTILDRLRLRDQRIQEERNAPVQAELTYLKFNVRMVNQSLAGLHTSLGTVAHQVDRANSSWHERELRMAQQIKGVVQLVGHQASMLGAGERKLTRLRGELQGVKRRLAEEVRMCQSTATVVKKEVTEVGGRVANVEDQCKGLNNLAEDLERIRDELEKQSSGLLLHMNGTLSSHAQQLSELKDELRNCNSKENAADSPADVSRGDTFTLN